MRSWELQQAIFARLNGFAGLTALASVHDEVPKTAGDNDSQGYPYVKVGDDSEAEDFDTDDSIGAEHLVTIHTYSRENGARECKLIQRQIYEALHRVVLVVANVTTFVNGEIEFEDVDLEPSGLTRHGTTRYRALLDGV